MGIIFLQGLDAFWLKTIKKFLLAGEEK